MRVLPVRRSLETRMPHRTRDRITPAAAPLPPRKSINPGVTFQVSVGVGDGSAVYLPTKGGMTIMVVGTVFGRVVGNVVILVVGKVVAVVVGTVVTVVVGEVVAVVVGDVVTVVVGEVVAVVVGDVAGISVA